LKTITAYWVEYLIGARTYLSIKICKIIDPRHKFLS